ncbi:methyltransferase domain-containing protein [Dermacoccus nishinomiyaensis]|uniref:methyltransferase domain-containing protein n=1 Tax=Dermacoccus nishinomiyaensis TaxID=1274 RepID=UPI00248F2B14|nr:methyltransferase domain-containing protein [Dermacoccus nishinomiyaensis]
MHCHYFDVGACRSCTNLTVPYDEQLTRKQTSVEHTLAARVAPEAWLSPAASRPTAFRNKVKLAVGGHVDAPTLGLALPGRPAVDLRECPIQERPIWDVVPDLAGFITYARLMPYDVDARTGELKFVIVTTNTDGELLVRFVVRTNDGVDRLSAALPALTDRLPQIVAVSANIHPEHKAVVEGDVEIALTPRQTLRAPIGDVTLHLQHRSFFQTNTDVAAALYRQARAWADDVDARQVLDLYCGVGGFALHLADGTRRVHGVEIEPSAIDSARRSATEAGSDATVTFDVGDASTLVMPEHDVPDLVVVNPPRRGIEALADALERSCVAHVIYSSCNPTSLAADLAAMPSFDVRAARLFDMFPHTNHAEVAALLSRRPA